MTSLIPNPTQISMPFSIFSLNDFIFFYFALTRYKTFNLTIQIFFSYIHNSPIPLIANFLNNFLFYNFLPIFILVKISTFIMLLKLPIVGYHG